MKTIIRYVRDDAGHPYATIVCDAPDRVAWSICRETDRFSKKLGREIALGRLIGGIDQHKTMRWLSRRTMFVRLAIVETLSLANAYARRESQ